MATRLSWAERIERAKKRGRFTPKEVFWAEYSWRTCAIGERHHWPTDHSFEPEMHTEEFRLGDLFGHAVEDQDIEEAERIYAQIQALPPIGATP
jgi:hypothetical protein